MFQPIIVQGAKLILFSDVDPAAVNEKQLTMSLDANRGAMELWVEMRNSGI